MSLRKRGYLEEGAGGYSRHGLDKKGVHAAFRDLTSGPTSVPIYLVIEIVQGTREFEMSGSILRLSNWLTQAKKDNPDKELKYRITYFTSDRNDARKKAQEI